MATLATLELPHKTIPPGKRPAGLYLYQDEHYRTVVGTPNRTVWVVAHACSDPQTCWFTPQDNNLDPNNPDHWAYNLNLEPGTNFGIPADDDIQALQPDFAGHLWFTSDKGVAGVLDINTGQMLGSVQLDGKIVNGSAADQQGGYTLLPPRPCIAWTSTRRAGRSSPGRSPIRPATV